MSLLRRRRAEQDDFAGSLDPTYPPAGDIPDAGHGHMPASAPHPDETGYVERPPSKLRRAADSMAATRRRVLPLPDEVIDQYLGNGERMIHNDHPSFRSFLVQNTLLFTGFVILVVLFTGISFKGSFLAASFLLLALCTLLLVLVLKRLGDRYTSYVVTDTRIMRISGVISRRAHSIPWVRVTDLTIEQTLSGRLFGYATLHIESANEDSGLRDLDGVSDPLQFNQFVVDMVVAKQGSTAPKWEEMGQPAPEGLGRGLRRMRTSRRRRRDEAERGITSRRTTPSEATGATEGEDATPSSERTERVRLDVGPRLSSRRVDATVSYGDHVYDQEEEDLADLDDDAIHEMHPEDLAARLHRPGDPDLPWGRDRR